MHDKEYSQKTLNEKPDDATQQKRVEMLELIFVAAFLTVVTGTIAIFSAVGYIAIFAGMIVALTLMVIGAVICSMESGIKQVRKATKKQRMKNDRRQHKLPCRRAENPPQTVIQIAVNPEGVEASERKS